MTKEKEFQGTKGEWRFNLTFEQDQLSSDTISTKEHVICTMNDVWRNTYLSEEVKANAKLIAAAPELLKSSIMMSKAISNGDKDLLHKANLAQKVAINKAI